MKNIKNSIYKIITSQGTGTGFKVAGNDLMITNYHVIEGSKTVAVEDHDRNRFLAHVVMANPEVDLAFLKIPELEDKEGAITIDEDIAIANLQKIYINGFPFGMPFTVTEGIVSSPNQPMEGRKYLQTDAAVNPGNSGGPMVNENGVLMAITTSKFNNADNVGFGIQHKTLVKELNDYNYNDTSFHLKCNSCDNFTIEASEFCVNCGNNIDKSVFEEFEKSHFAKFTEDALVELGANPVLCRAGRDYWEFHQGSALVRIFVMNDTFLFATSPLNKLPKENLKPLLTYLNSNQVPPYQLGIYDNKIYISYRAHLSDIYSPMKDEIKNNLIKLPLKADDLDDFFKDNYGCEMSMESKSINEDVVATVQKNAIENEDVANSNENEGRIQGESTMDKLKKLKELFEMELISQEDYDKKKNDLLSLI